MPSSNFLNSVVINAGGAAGGLLKNAGLQERLTGSPGRIQIIVRDGVVLQADATISETHAMESQPTVFPLEDGSVISDHIIQQPPVITVTGVVTDTPIITKQNFLATEIGAAVSGFIPPLGITVAGAAYRLATYLQNAPLPSQTAYDTLNHLRTGQPYANPPVPPEPFTLVTKYARYPKMVIQNLNFPVDASTDGMLTFTMTCVRLNIVTPTFGIAEVVQEDPKLTAAKKKGGAKSIQDQYFDNGLKLETEHRNTAVEQLGKLNPFKFMKVGS